MLEDGRRKMPIVPRVPAWALATGCPAPYEGETFSEYVGRLGLDPEELLLGLNERTYVLANQRLASALIRRSPDSFAAYVRARRAAFTSDIFARDGTPSAVLSPH